jgi:hypothetical protein
VVKVVDSARKSSGKDRSALTKVLRGESRAA